MHERIQRHIPPELTRPKSEVRVPNQFVEKLRNARHLIIDLDDTLIVYDPEKTVLRVAWFALCDSNPKLDPKSYQRIVGQGIERDAFIEEIETLSEEKYGDSGYLFRVGYSWANAFRFGGERDVVVRRSFGYGQDTKGFWSRYAEFRRQNQEVPDEIEVAEGGIDFLNWAYENGRSLHIISNSEPSIIESYLKQITESGYRGEFENVISAVERGREFRKPHLSSLEMLMENLQEEQPQAAYIGNEEEDVSFATNAAKQAAKISVVPVLITRGLDYSDIEMSPHCEFPSFSDLTNFLAD